MSGLLLPFRGSFPRTQPFGPAAGGVASLEPVAWVLRDDGKWWRANLDELAGGTETKVHMGVDYGTPVGTKLHAPAAGRIVHQWWDPRGGRQIELKIAGRSTWIVMAHLESFALREGAAVDAGELIGASGRSGKVTGAHLHLEVIHGADRSRYNPVRLLQDHDKATTSWIAPT